MAASPVNVPSAPLSNARRRPLVLTQRRLEANRRNAARSTGPRTLEGKAKVARNPIKHGFFVVRDRWTSQQQRDFEDTLAGLREDFKPDDALEESCVRTIAESYVKMAAVLRYENIAALKYHQECERELNQRIAMADAAQAAHLRAGRERLRRAGLWRPTIPGPREAAAILRYEGSLNRAIRHAVSELHALKNLRIDAKSPPLKVQKQTHYSAAPNSGPEALRRASAERFDDSPAPSDGPEAGKGPRVSPSSPHENAKTNPLTSMFTGNRHQRRRAKALAARGR